MSLGDRFVPFSIKTFPRRYALTDIQGQQKLACFVNEEWIIDATCKTINEMLSQGLVSPDAVTGWIATQPTSEVH